MCVSILGRFACRDKVKIKKILKRTLKLRVLFLCLSECYIFVMQEKEYADFIQKSPTGKKGEYVVAPSDCAVCQATDFDGNWVRFEIDKYLITHSPKQAVKWCLDKYALKFTPKRLELHMKKHSSYIEESKKTAQALIEKTATRNLEKIEEVFIDAEDVLQDIITAGGQRIRAGEMKVTDRLLLGAISEQGKRKQMGTLQQIFAELDKGRFVEGEVVEEEKDDKEEN